MQSAATMCDRYTIDETLCSCFQLSALRRNATKIPGEHPFGKRCRNATGCRRGSLCGKENCHQMCYTCKEVDCQTVCKAYNDDPCKELQKPPYICNVCSRRRKCKSDRVYYTAQQADAVAKRRYAEARNKPQMQKEAMAALDALVTPLIKKGQPLTHIYAEHGAELPVSQRTLYNYGKFKYMGVYLRWFYRKIFRKYVNISPVIWGTSFS